MVKFAGHTRIMEVIEEWVEDQKGLINKVKQIWKGYDAQRAKKREGHYALLTYISVHGRQNRGNGERNRRDGDKRRENGGIVLSSGLSMVKHQTEQPERSLV